MRITKELPDSLLEKYEFLDYGHAIEILRTTYSQEWKEIMICLDKFFITKNDIVITTIV